MAKNPKKKAPEEAKPRARGPHVTTPEARANARWRSALFATRQPQYPRQEMTTDGKGNRVIIELPPQSRATKREFLQPGPAAVGVFIIPGS